MPKSVPDSSFSSKLFAKGREKSRLWQQIDEDRAEYEATHTEYEEYNLLRGQNVPERNAKARIRKNFKH